MARPKPDYEAVRESILELAEAQLIQTGGRRLVLSDIAHSLGMSQPYVHGFFSTKSELVRALAQRWFDKVEAEGQKIVNSYLEPEQKLRSYLHTVYSVKRSALHKDRQLFAAYLDLATQHMDIVREHTAILRQQLESCVADIVPAEATIQATNLIEDATVMFRNPRMIMTYDNTASPKRLDRVVDAILSSLPKK